MASIFSRLKPKVVLVNSVQYALDSVQYAENIARLLQCKVNGKRFRYIIISSMYLDALQCP